MVLDPQIPMEHGFTPGEILCGPLCRPTGAHIDGDLVEPIAALRAVRAHEPAAREVQG
jgi:hypothetical protein